LTFKTVSCRSAAAGAGNGMLMSNWRAIAIAVVFAGVACSPHHDSSTVATAPDARDDFSIAMRMTSMGLWSRAYEFEIDQTGMAIFRGKYGAHDFASEPIHLTPDRVDTLRRAIKEAAFFDLGDSYGIDRSVIDAGIVQITVKTPRGTKTVTYQELSAEPSPELRRVVEFARTIHRTVDTAPLLEKYCALPRT
jgi:hypothetical protein